MADNAFLWEDYSADPSDRGVSIQIEHHGKDLPFRIRRSLTIDERQRANEAAIEIQIDKNGLPIITKQDQAAYTKEIVLIGLKHWPFEYSPGKPVPLTRANILKLDGSLLDKLAAAILGATEVKAEQYDPFGSPSVAALSTEEVPNHK
jgi:hypothetical protein